VSFNPPPRVFISYARKDGEVFATGLCRRLQIEEPEITLWQDRAQMESGVGWWKQIEEALDKVKFLVIVMTPAAMTSEITRREWRYARQKGVVVYLVKGAVDGTLDYASLPAWMRKTHFFDLGKEWETFTNYLKSDRQPVRVPFMAPDLPKAFVPRPREFEALLHLLLDRTRQHPVAITTALRGAGGYGKTTLATALCHYDRVIDAFDDGILWVTLGQTPDVLGELAKAYEALTGEQGGFVDVEHGARKLAEKLEHKDCLVVIDDAWEQVHVAPFLRGGHGCVRLLTTRRLDLEPDAARVTVDEMTSEESVAVLAAAFDELSAPEALLQPLARRLGEWPLLLRLVAGMLRKRLARGDSVEGAVTYVGKALDKRGITAFDSVNASERDKAVALTVAASRDLLSLQDRRRLAELAVFPEEAQVPLTTLSRLWGLDELDTEECAQRLDDVALVTLSLRERTLSLHDVMRAFLLAEMADAPRLHATLTAGYRDHLSLPDAYAWRWLPYHLAQAGEHERLRSLLLDPAWLQAQLAGTDVHAVVGSFDHVHADIDLGVLQRALRLSMHVLSVLPDQLAEQLHGRLRVGTSETLDIFIGKLTRLEPRPRLHARWPSLEEPGSGLLQVLTGHEGWVEGAHLLPDGRVLSWSRDRTLRLWDLATSTAQVLTGHTGAVRGAQLLPDGRVLSWGDDRTLRLWNLATGTVQVLTGHRLIAGAQLLPDGRVLSWGDDRTLRLWDLATGTAQVLTGHTRAVRGARLLPDGRVLSWGDDRTLRLWDLATSTAQVLTGHKGWVEGAQLLSDGRLLSWGHETLLWNLSTGTPQVLTGQAGWVTSAQLLPDGRILSWNNSLLRLWDHATDTAQLLIGHAGAVYGALLLPDGRVLSWSNDGTLRLWDLATGKAQVLTAHTGSVHGAQLLPNTRVLSWGDDRTLRLWDFATDTAQVLTGHAGEVTGAQLVRDGKVLSWSDDRTLRLWDLATGMAQVFTGHNDSVNGTLLLPDGRVLSWSGDGSLRLWDLATGTAQVLKGYAGKVTGAQLVRDGKVLSWSGDGSLRLWDLATSTAQVLRGHAGWVVGAQLLPDGRVLSWSRDRTLRLWDLATSTARVLTGHTGAVRGAQLLPDGRVLSWSSDGTLRLWDLATGTAQVLPSYAGLVLGAQLLPDGRVLTWGGGRTLRLWDLATSTAQVLTGHTGKVTGAQLLPDGRVLTWGGDRTLRLWDLATSTAQVLTGHAGKVTGAQLVPGGRVLSRSHDRTVRVWELSKGHQVSRYDFDARPTTVVRCEDGYFVGDALGRVHFLEWLGQPASVTST
jgi:WD40 repeat protein